MGINLESSNVMLPTTRLVLELKRLRGIRPDIAGPFDPGRARPDPEGALKRAAVGLKLSLRLVNQLGEEWFRQFLAWNYRRRGYIVLFDRHFFSDYYAYDVVDSRRKRPLTGRIHGFVLKHLYPKPDLLIYLDAPAEVLFARKGEGTIELLEQRRQEYMQLRDLVEHFVVVDASKPEHDVAQAVTDLIQESYERKAGAVKKMRDASG
jgi:hypothetical protein